MIKINLNEVKTQLSKYIEMVEAGEVVVVCKRNVPVAEIRSISNKEKKTPELGWAESVYEVPANFKELTEKDLLEWEGDDNDPLRKYAPKPRSVKKGMSASGLRPPARGRGPMSRKSSKNGRTPDGPKRGSRNK